MVESEAIKAALSCVKPLCMELVQSPNTRKIQAITMEMKKYDEGVVQALQKFLIFPLRTVLVQCANNSLPEQLLIETCQAFNVLVSKSTIEQPAIFMDLFSILSGVIFGHLGNGMKSKSLSEEEKMATVETLCCLLDNSHPQVLHEIYTPRNIAQLGSLVSQLVAMASDAQTSRTLRAEAMNALLVLMRKRTYDYKHDWWHHSSRFAGLFPGISTAMLKMLIGDRKQGHQIFCRFDAESEGDMKLKDMWIDTVDDMKALDVWTEVVCLTLGDESLELEQKEGHAWIGELKMDARLKELIIKRDKEWVQSVVPRVEFMIKELNNLKKHDNWKVRQALVSWADRLLSHCQQSLSSCLSPILDVLVLLMTDSYSQVAAPARTALEKYRDKQTRDYGCQPLLELLKENLYALVTSLPRRIRMEDEEEKCAVVGLLNGYISLMGDHMSSLLMSLPHITRLTKVLVLVLALDVSDQKILEESGMGSRGSADISRFVQRVNVLTPRKVFVHFRDENVKSALLKTCRLLGFYGDLSILVECFLDLYRSLFAGDLSILVECFLDLYRESAVHQLSCVLIINEILAGHRQGQDMKESKELCDVNEEGIVRMLLEEYLSYDNMTLMDGLSLSLPEMSSSTSVSLNVVDDPDSASGQKILTRNRTIMLTCLFLEGVSVCAQVMGKKFQLLLMDVLYPVAEKVGSEVSAVSSTAYLTLCHLADACGFSTVSELIQSNADYLVNSISLCLRHFHRHKRAPSVLSVMLQICTNNILCLIWDSIVEILDTLDEHHVDQAATFLPVLYQLTLAVARWFPVQPDSKKVESSIPCRKLNPEELTTFLLDRHYRRLEAEAYDASPDTQSIDAIQEEACRMAEEGKLDEKEEEMQETEEKKDPPLHVKAVKEVLLRTKHLVSSSDPRLTLLALDVIAQGCCAIADHQNELLPVVHQLWPSFKQRFQDTEKLVVIKAVKSLHKLCSCCGDFIRQRVEKDVFPYLKSFLEKQAHLSQRCGSGYCYTVNFKLQLTLLSTLGEMAQMMGLDGNALEQVIYCCLPYLSQHQAPKLQQASMESLKQLISCDADLVWLALSGLYLPTVPTPPSANFKPVTVLMHPEETNEYSANVTTLLDYMDSS